MKKKVILLRHGRTGYSQKYIGSSDVGLSSEGKKQIAEVRTRLLQEGITKLIASPMLRCQQSCEILDLGIDIEVNNNLREIDFGKWEKKTFQEIVDQDPGKVNQWVADPRNFVFPGGEAVSDFIARVKEVKKHITGFSQDTLLIVSHGGVIRLLICLLLSLNPDNYLLFDVKKGNFSALELYEGQAVLTQFNHK